MAEAPWLMTPIADSHMGIGVKISIFVFFRFHLQLTFWAQGSNGPLMVYRRKLEPGCIKTLFLTQGCRINHSTGTGRVIFVPLFSGK